MNQNFYNSNSSVFDQIQPPQYPVIHDPPQETSEEILEARENLMQSIQTFLKDIHELLRKLFEDLQIINEELAEYIISPSWNRPTFYDDDDDEYSIQVSEFLKKSPIAIAPVLPTEDPDNSLSMGDEHLDTIPEIESDEIIKSSVEDLVPIPSESEGILDSMCDVPFSDKNHFDVESNLIKSLLTQDNLIVYSSKIGSLLEEFAGELVHIDPIPPGIDEIDFDPKYNIHFIDLEEVKDDILRTKLLNIHLLISKIELLNNNPTPDCVLKSPSLFFLSYTDNSSPEFETFSYHTKETSSGSTTTHANNFLLEYDSFLFEIKPDQGELTSVVMNDISDNSTNDPLMEVVDLFLALDNSIPPGIENVDYDSEGDILEELLKNDSLPLPEFESFHFDLYDDPLSARPLKKPPDDGILTKKVVDDISNNSTRELYVHVLNILPSFPPFIYLIGALKFCSLFIIMKAR
uniref:Reverse transcriptase domain-containing protein n=1 Tax=Tanacetum cinerariifolium TaxID=118510 RepID=A0A6L2LD20_TANCI|nr:hypothetical protein [Tanacetum cinerariifolium]